MLMRKPMLCPLRWRRGPRRPWPSKLTTVPCAHWFWELRFGCIPVVYLTVVPGTIEGNIGDLHSVNCQSGTAMSLSCSVRVHG